MKKSKIAGKSPQMEQLEFGKTYAWCACGMSANQPWCNGFHKGTNFSPSVFKANESKTAAMCMCKQTKNPPFCDGSHREL
tara:strand:+ start:1022 stop:1261 length:240 start_codon:yes stop_codon:yes gene_type:complete